MTLDGGLGYVLSSKSDGYLAVRPVDRITGGNVPNQSLHWSLEDRLKIPHELAVHPYEIRPAKWKELPFLPMLGRLIGV